MGVLALLIFARLTTPSMSMALSPSATRQRALAVLCRPMGFFRVDGDHFLADQFLGGLDALAVELTQQRDEFRVAVVDVRDATGDGFQAGQLCGNPAPMPGEDVAVHGDDERLLYADVADALCHACTSGSSARTGR